MATPEIANVVDGNFGTKIVLNMVDANGTAVDVSSYAGVNIVTFNKPDNGGIQSFTLDFNTDGIDGKLKFTPDSGELDTKGDWDGTVELKVGATVVARSSPFVMEVLKAYTV